MSEIILPIRKIYVDRIFSGEKKYEFRKTLPKQPVESVLIYESSGSGKIVGRFTVTGIINDRKEDVYEMTKEHSGIGYNDFMAYFKRQPFACAYVIGNVEKFDRPLELSDFGLTKAPQNYVYVKK